MTETNDNNIESFIVKGVISFSNFAAKYMDKLQPEYFSVEFKPTIKAIKAFYNAKHKVPNAVIIEEQALPKMKELRDNSAALEGALDAFRTSMSLDITEEKAYEWLEESTQNFIKKKRFQNAFVQAMTFYENNDIDSARKAIDESGNITFEETLGLNYFDDLTSRMERARTGEALIPSGMPALDRIIGGGWHKKSLNLFMAGTNVGKTLILADTSLRLLSKGLNGVYLTMEIYEDLLANRIDANLTNIALSEIPDNVDAVERMVMAAKKKESYGTLYIKEFPPNGVNCNQIRTYLRELELKKKFKPDFIVLDYLALIGPNGKTFSDNTYGKLKTVSEEVRHLACEFKVPIFSATQTNRSGLNNSHVGLENVADSTGIAFTADLIISATRDESMDKENKMRWYVNKSRFSRNGSELYVGVDYTHQRIIPADEAGNVDYTSSTPSSQEVSTDDTTDISA